MNKKAIYGILSWACLGVAEAGILWAIIVAFMNYGICFRTVLAFVLVAIFGVIGSTAFIGALTGYIDWIKNRFESELQKRLTDILAERSVQ